MASDYSTNNLRSKLDDLTLGSKCENLSERFSPKQQPVPTKSLLSKSLAGERFDIKNPEDNKIFTIGESYVPESQEHPEPTILATSVGKQPDGRFIPSSSTISLLSLSNNANSGSLAMSSMDMQPLSCKSTSFVSGTTEKVTSHTTLKSRNSITHFSQQRLQPYQRLNSPQMPSGAEFTAISSPKNIPLAKNSAYAPDSPSLNPTSIGESPSRLWLSSQTPPKFISVSGASLRSRSSAQSLMGFHPAYPEKVPAVFHSQNMISDGSHSPVLNPVQTPLEDMPMTPLHLNSASDNYFVLTNNNNTSDGVRRDYFHGISEYLPYNAEKKDDSDSDEEMS